MIATLQLSPAESVALRNLAQLLKQAAPSAWQQAMRNAQGIWRDRTDLPDFEKLRAEGNRYLAT